MGGNPKSSSDPAAALEAIGALPDDEIDLADAALQLARIGEPEADWQAARAHLSELAREAVWKSSGLITDDLAGRLDLLRDLIFVHNGYRGDVETYDDPANANLIRVTERRRGLPVSLGVIWLHAARAAGWAAHGIDFPGHFLMAMEGPAASRNEARATIDVFAGGARLAVQDLRALIKRVEGPGAELNPALLQPMSSRAVLLRLQNNIKARCLGEGDIAGAVEMVETMLAIAPREAKLWREAALMNQRLDRVSAALRCFERFLDLSPWGESAARARTAIEELRARLH